MSKVGTVDDVLGLGEGAFDTWAAGELFGRSALGWLGPDEQPDRVSAPSAPSAVSAAAVRLIFEILAIFGGVLFGAAFPRAITARPESPGAETLKILKIPKFSEIFEISGNPSRESGAAGVAEVAGDTGDAAEGGPENLVGQADPDPANHARRRL